MSANIVELDSHVRQSLSVLDVCCMQFLVGFLELQKLKFIEILGRRH